jgi:biotin-dependent carboxylase-like uncharacterized protein
VSIRILRPGPLALVEDLGRPGHAHLGVSPSGALDRGALRLANRLVGDEEGCAGLELLLGGFEARFESAAWFAVTGAVGSVRIDDRPIDRNSAQFAAVGSVLTIGAPVAGMRSYLAVRGGFAVPEVLGSRSHDQLSGLGPPPLTAGQVLPVGPRPAVQVPPLDFAPVADPPPEQDAVELRASRGPRADWFTRAAQEAFFAVDWRLSPSSNRVGARLDPPRIPAHARRAESLPVPLLERSVTDELPSEPMIAGSVQVSPDGRPTVLLADHPVTGGYPVIAVVASGSLDALAQVRPGQRVRFRHA